jgi:fibronectin type 3 domain-containing protein
VTFAPTAIGTFSGTASLKSNATDSPTNEPLSGSGVKVHSVSLTWTGSRSTGVIGYDVYRGVVSGGPYTRLNASLVPETSYTDTTVDAGHTYYYVTTAVTSTKQSLYSDQVMARVPSP